MKHKNNPQLSSVLVFSMLQLICLAVLFISIDFLSKNYIHTHLDHGESISIIGDFIRITHVRNFVIAFGFMSRNNWYGLPLAIFFGGSLIILIVNFQSTIIEKLPFLKRLSDYIFTEIGSLDITSQQGDDIQAKKTITIHKLLFPLLIAGAFGNLIDRFRYGYVVDFIDMGLLGYRWPTFNFADFFLISTTIIFVLGGINELIDSQITESKESIESEEEDMPLKSSTFSNFLSLEITLIIICSVLAFMGFFLGKYESVIKENIHLIQAFIVCILVIALVRFFLAIEIDNFSNQQQSE